MRLCADGEMKLIEKRKNNTVFSRTVFSVFLKDVKVLEPAHLSLLLE